MSAPHHHNPYRYRHAAPEGEQEIVGLTLSADRRPPELESFEDKTGDAFREVVRKWGDRAEAEASSWRGAAATGEAVPADFVGGAAERRARLEQLLYRTPRLYRSYGRRLGCVV